MTWENYYQILNYSREVKKIERPKEIFLKFHTDKNNKIDKEKEETIRKIHIAWDILKDRDKRIIYDYSNEERWEKLKKEHGERMESFPIKISDINLIKDEKQIEKWEKEQMLQLVRISFLSVLCWSGDDALKKLIKRYYPSEEPKLTVEELKKEAWSRLENHPNKDEIKLAIEIEKKREEERQKKIKKREENEEAKRKKEAELRKLKLIEEKKKNNLETTINNKEKNLTQEQQKQGSRVIKDELTSPQIHFPYFQEKKEQKILNKNEKENNNKKFRSNYNTYYTIILTLITITINLSLLTTFFPSSWIKKIITYWLNNFNSTKIKKW